MTDEQYAEHTAMFNQRQLEVDREYMVKIAEAVKEHCLGVRERNGEAAAMLINVGIMLWQHAAEVAVTHGESPDLENANAMLAGILNAATSYAIDVAGLRSVIQNELDSLIKLVNNLQGEYNDAMQAAQGLPN